MQNDKRLLSCPFCGGEVKLVYIHEELGLVCVDSEEELEDDSISAFIHCYGCSTEVFPQEAETPKTVIEAWNTRKPMERIVEQLEEQKCEYEKIFNRLKYEVPNQATYYLGLHSGCEISEHIVRNGGKE